MFVYLDNSATTQVKQLVAEIMAKTMTEDFGNPSSLHRMGVNAEKILKKARAQVAAALNASPEEIFFTSCATESANTAIKGYMSRNKRAGNAVISTRTEHKATLECLEYLSKSLKYLISFFLAYFYNHCFKLQIYKKINDFLCFSAFFQTSFAFLS